MENIEENVLTIENGIVKACDKDAVNVVVTEGVKEIGAKAFFYCQSLSSVVIPEGVTKICYEAFFGCSALKSISLPSTLTEIGKKAFYGCDVVESITSASTLYPFDEKKRKLYDATGKRKKAILTLMAAKEKAKKEKVAKIQNVSAIALVESVVDEYNEIASVVRNGKNSYLRINIGKCGIEILLADSKVSKWGQALTSLLDFAATCNDAKALRKYAADNGFEDASRKYLYVRNEIVKIRKNTNPVHIVIDGATKIRRKAFERCSLLKSVVIDSGVSEIGKHAFGYCTELESIEIPETVTEIGDNAFIGCRSLESVSFGGTVAQWKALTAKKKNPLVYSPVKSVRCSDGECGKPVCLVVGYARNKTVGVPIGEDVTKIPEKVISNRKSIVFVQVPEGITEIGSGAFQNCDMKNVILPSTLTEIGESAFEGCKNLAFVIFPVGMKKIGVRAFFGCESLRIMWYEGSERNWPKIELGADWCKGTKVQSLSCYGFDNITVKNGVVTSCRKDALNVVLPKNVTKISNEAFKDCASLGYFTFDSGLTEIGDNAFQNCTSLSVVVFEGPMSEWKAVKKSENWNKDVPAKIVHCTDGEVAL